MNHDFKVGETVTIHSPGHRHDGRTDTVSYIGTMFGTVGVSIDGEDYGFMPYELTLTGETK